MRACARFSPLCPMASIWPLARQARGRGLRGVRYFVAQRLQQSQHAVRALAEPISTGQMAPSRSSFGEIVEHLRRAAARCLEQLLHQLIVMVGELFQHREARVFLARLSRRIELDDLARRVLAINKRALQREIDEADDDAVLPDRDLPQHQRHVATKCCKIESISRKRLSALSILLMNRRCGMLRSSSSRQHELQLRRLALVRLAYHHRRVDRRQRRAHFLREFDRAGTIQKRIGVAEKIGRSGGKLDAHFMRARLKAAVTNSVSRLDLAGPRDRAGARSIASSNVVLPDWKGPTSAMHRGPRELMPCELEPLVVRFCLSAIEASL